MSYATIATNLRPARAQPSQPSRPLKDARLLSRLQRDLQELYEHPYPGVEIFHHDDNLHNFCLHLCPPAGPFKGLRLHFTVELPLDWPSSPPEVQASSAIDHPNVFGSYICCDLLKRDNELAEYYTDKSYNGGYTPAFTLRGLFLQFLSFFTSDKVAQEGNGYEYSVAEKEREVYVDMKRFPGGRASWDSLSDYEHYFFMDTWPKQAHLKRLWDLQHAEGGYKASKDDWKFPSVIGELDIVWPTAVKTAPDAAHVVVKVVEKKTRVFKATCSAAEKFRCSHCGYGNKLTAYDSPFQPTMLLNTAGTTNVKDPAEAADAMEIDSPSLAASDPSINTTGTNPLDFLPPELLWDVADKLTSESIINFAKAYSRFQLTANKALMQQEIRCFFLRNTFADRSTILGVGINVKSSPLTLNSSFDWISRTAFETYRVRKSSDKRAFTHFLPMALGPMHFQRVNTGGHLWHYLTRLSNSVVQAKDRRAAPGESEQEYGLRALYKLCNSMVVQLMKTSEAALVGSKEEKNSRKAQAALLFASEKTCTGYTQVIYLLISIFRKYPELRSRALARLVEFRDKQSKRVKSSCADLGELLVCAAAVAGSYEAPIEKEAAVPETTDAAATVFPAENKRTYASMAGNSSQKWTVVPKNGRPKPVKTATGTISWTQDLQEPFIGEFLNRLVFWALKSHPELELLEEGISTYRLHQAFSASTTSWRLLMFQVSFWELFITPHLQNPHGMGERNGFPEPGLPERIVAEIRSIYAVDKLGPALQRVAPEMAPRMMVNGALRACNLLRQAVVNSAQAGYHRAKSPQHLEDLKEVRRRQDRTSRDISFPKASLHYADTRFGDGERRGGHQGRGGRGGSRGRGARGGTYTRFD